MAENKIKAAQVTGLDEAAIKTVGAQLDVLRTQGILVDLSIRGTSMFTRKANHVELGVMSETTQKRYTAGSKYLIDREEVNALKSCETMFRQALEKYTSEVTGFKPYRWLGYTAWPKFVERFNEVKTKWDEIKGRIIANYDEYVEQAKADYSASAHGIWDDITAAGYEAIIWDKAYLSRDEFVDAVVARSLAKMPTREDIERDLTADYLVGVVYGAQDYAADKVVAAEHEVELAGLQAEVAQAKKIQNQAIAEKQEKLRHKMKMNQLREAKEQAKINAMFEAEMEHAREQIQAVGSPLAEVVHHLRAQVAKDVDTMLKSIKRNGFLHGKVAEKGHGLLEFYELMATHNDKHLRNKLEVLKAQIGPVGTKETPERDLEQIQATLEEITGLANENLASLTEVSRAAFLEL